LNEPTLAQLRLVVHLAESHLEGKKLAFAGDNAKEAFATTWKWLQKITAIEKDDAKVAELATDVLKERGTRRRPSRRRSTRRRPLPTPRSTPWPWS
jgi:hypothetical protein